MSITLIGTPANNLVFSNLYGPESGADAVIFATSMVGAGSLDVSNVTVTGDISGTASLGAGTLNVVKQISTVTNNQVALIIWIPRQTLPQGNLSGAITWTGTPNGSASLRTVCYSVASSTGVVSLDTSVGQSITSVTNPWPDGGGVTVAAQSFQVYSLTTTSPFSSITSVGNTAPVVFAEDRDVNDNSVGRMGAGHYNFNAGGTRGYIAALSQTDTGAITVASFIAGVSPGGASRGQMLLGVG